MKQKVAIAAILMVITGFGMMHSATGNAEIFSLVLIGCGTLILIGLLLKQKTP